MPLLTRAEILAHPLYPAIEKQIARHLTAIHIRTPRMSRLKASHRKWLMTQCVFSLAFRRREDDPMSGLTATRFVDTVMRLGASSRNTATSYLAEMVAYKFLRDVPDVPDKRVRVLEPTEISMNGLRSWFNGHLACLDRLDGGNREMTSLTEDKIFLIAQPIGADIMLADPMWREPPDTIGHFLWSDLGGIILHDLFARLDNVDRNAPTNSCGPVSLAELSETYQLSTTNLKRMFKKAESEELLSWEQPRRRGDLLLTSRFIEDYFIWQSAKFVAINQSYYQALTQLGIKAENAAAA